jgi:hypothetical protein
MARARKTAALGRSGKESSQVSDDEGSNYFDIVRSLSNDPELQRAVDVTEKKLETQGQSKS